LRTASRWRRPIRSAQFGWFGVFSAARTPQPIVMKLNAELSALIKEPDVRDRLLANGAEPLSGPPGDLRRYLAGEIEKWGKVIREAGIKAE
jgi:tripartite-type tricarboxylate transporter receptor subunit TctC